VTLAAIIVIACRGLLDFDYAWWLLKLRRNTPKTISPNSDIVIWVLGFAVTVGLGVIFGIFVSMLASLVQVTRRAYQVPMVEVGQMAGRDHAVYRRVELVGDVEYRPLTIDGVRILRIDGVLFFANTAKLVEAVHHMEMSSSEEWALVLDIWSVGNIDATALGALQLIFTRLKKAGTRVYVANIKIDARKMLRQISELQELPQFQTGQCALDDTDCVNKAQNDGWLLDVDQAVRMACMALHGKAMNPVEWNKVCLASIHVDPMMDATAADQDEKQPSEEGLALNGS